MKLELDLQAYQTINFVTLLLGVLSAFIFRLVTKAYFVVLLQDFFMLPPIFMKELYILQVLSHV